MDPFWWEIAFPDWWDLVKSVSHHDIYLAEWVVIGTFCDYIHDYTIFMTYHRLLGERERDKFDDEFSPYEFSELIDGLVTNNAQKLEIAQIHADRVRNQSRRFIHYILGSIFTIKKKTLVMKHWRISFKDKTFTETDSHGHIERKIYVGSYWIASFKE